MALLHVIVDLDPERLASIEAAAQRRLSTIPGLRPRRSRVGSLCLNAAFPPDAPLQIAEAAGTCCVRVGHSERSNAKAPLPANGSSAAEISFPRPTYGCTITYDIHSGLVAECDRLGMFPLFYATSSEGLAIASSPTLLACHVPSRGIDDEAIAAILLTGAPMNGATLWRGIKRLPRGARLTWCGGVTEVRCGTGHPLQRKSAGAHLETREADEWFDRSFRDAVARSIPGDDAPPPILLSGGLDSRMLAAILRDQGKRPVSMCIGRQSDIEMRCARRVAQAVGFPFETIRDEPAWLIEGMRRQIEWDGFASGCYEPQLYWHFTQHRPTNLGPLLGSGLLLDAIAGGAKGVPPNHRSPVFDDLLPAKTGLGLAALQQHANSAGLRDAADTFAKRAVEEFEASGSNPGERAWRFNLATRQRFLVAPMAWRMSWSTWPCLPALDGKLLECCASIGETDSAHRGLQIRWLIRHAPDLARLPLDRNSYGSSPLVSRWQTQALDTLIAKIDWHWHRTLSHLGTERRFYVRVFDFNNSGWKRLRQIAHPWRHILNRWLKPQAVDAFLPDPQMNIAGGDAIMQSTFRKNLVGLVLWMRWHQEGNRF